jgi:hypothetical protein
MRYFVRWWETLGRAERIVALSIGLSAPIAIINSTVWAVAVAYMAHEKYQVDRERLRAQARSAFPEAGRAPGALDEARDARDARPTPAPPHAR